MLVLIYLRLRVRTSGDLVTFAGLAAVVGVLLAPSVWAGIPVWNSAATAFPAGGPRGALSVDDDPAPSAIQPRWPTWQPTAAANVGSS